MYETRKDQRHVQHTHDEMLQNIRKQTPHSKLTRGRVPVNLSRDLLNNGSRKVGWRQSCGKQFHSTLQFVQIAPIRLGSHNGGNVGNSCYMIWKISNIVVEWLSVMRSRVGGRYRLVIICSMSTVLVGMERIFLGALKIGATGRQCLPSKILLCHGCCNL